MPLTIVERTVTLTGQEKGAETVDSGMLVRLEYKTGIYNVFVIHPNKENPQTRSEQLHGYKLSKNATDSDFINFLVNLNSGLVVNSVDKELYTETMTDTAAYEARYILRGVDERPYRTFNVKDITSVTKLVIKVPDIIDKIVRGQITIIDKTSKRQLLTCLEIGDNKCIQDVPEIRARMIRDSLTTEQIETEEFAEREDAAGATVKVREISARRTFNTTQ